MGVPASRGTLPRMWFSMSSPDEGWLRALIARRRHSRWLTRAMRVGVRVPRIPTRRVDEGGFDALMTTHEGREWASHWWSEALQSPDPD